MDSGVRVGGGAAPPLPPAQQESKVMKPTPQRGGVSTDFSNLGNSTATVSKSNSFCFSFPSSTSNANTSSNGSGEAIGGDLTVKTEDSTALKSSSTKHFFGDKLDSDNKSSSPFLSRNNSFGGLCGGAGGGKSSSDADVNPMLGKTDMSSSLSSAGMGASSFLHHDRSNMVVAVGAVGNNPRPGSPTKQPLMKARYRNHCPGTLLTHLAPGVNPSVMLESPLLIDAPQVVPSPTSGIMNFGYHASKAYMPSDMSKETSHSSGFLIGRSQSHQRNDLSSSCLGGGGGGVVVGGGGTSPRAIPAVPIMTLSSSLQPHQESTTALTVTQSHEQVPQKHKPRQEPLEERRLVTRPVQASGRAAGGFQERSAPDCWNWRKYGQKHVKGSNHPRSYYKCTHPSCSAKKRVERTHSGLDLSVEYKNDHNHAQPAMLRRSANSAAARMRNSNLGKEAGKNSSGGPSSHLTLAILGSDRDGGWGNSGDGHELNLDGGKVTVVEGDGQSDGEDMWTRVHDTNRHALDDDAKSPPNVGAVRLDRLNSSGDASPSNCEDGLSSAITVTNSSPLCGGGVPGRAAQASARLLYHPFSGSASPPHSSLSRSSFSSADMDDLEDTEMELGMATCAKRGVEAGDDPDGCKKRRKDKKEGVPRAVREPRYVIQTVSEREVMDDGWRWRKYGQKYVKGKSHPRSYYKCTTPDCPVRKHVERSTQDPTMVITTYEGKHTHEQPEVGLRGGGNLGCMVGPSLLGGNGNGRSSDDMSTICMNGSSNGSRNGNGSRSSMLVQGTPLGQPPTLMLGNYGRIASGDGVRSSGVGSKSGSGSLYRGYGDSSMRKDNNNGAEVELGMRVGSVDSDSMRGSDGVNGLQGVAMALVRIGGDTVRMGGDSDDEGIVRGRSLTHIFDSAADDMDHRQHDGLDGVSSASNVARARLEMVEGRGGGMDNCVQPQPSF